MGLNSCLFLAFALAAGLQSRGAKFLTVDTNLLVFVDFGEIGLVFIASLSYVWAGYHAKTTVEAARQIKQE